MAFRIMNVTVSGTSQTPTKVYSNYSPINPCKLTFLSWGDTGVTVIDPESAMTIPSTEFTPPFVMDNFVGAIYAFASSPQSVMFTVQDGTAS